MYLRAVEVLCVVAVAAAAKRRAPTYAVSMEPVTQYSQRDPLYHTANNSTSHRRNYNSYPEPYYHPYSYPEPIIEIIIKESNQTLPPPTTPPPQPSTKEPIHVFYVKYKKNPNPKGEHDKIIYEKPVAALTTHKGDETSDSHHEHQEAPIYTATVVPHTTTLRTVIRPESETYHGTSGIRVSFGPSEEKHHEQEEGTEQRPLVALPDSHVRFPDRSPPPTPQQILSYQQHKQYLYEQSLQQQQQQQQQPQPQPQPQLTPSIPLAPANTPRQFQQPTKNRLSHLQISFQQQQLALQQQQQQLALKQHHQQLVLQQQQQFRASAPSSTYQTISDAQRRPHYSVSPSTDTNEKFQSPTRQPYWNAATRQPEVRPNALQSLPQQNIVQDASRHRLAVNYKPTQSPDVKHIISNGEPSQSFPDGEVVKSISQSEEHQIEHNFASHQYFQPEPTREVKITPQPIYYPIYSSTTGRPPIRTVARPSPTTTTTTTTEPEPEEELPPLNNTNISANIAALPDEVPADLREQLLSSGILSNADISVLDYDKVGDIPIDRLPPEALEQLYGAGSEQISAIAPAPNPTVQMKVVRFDPRTDHGQAVASAYIRPDATAVQPVLLSDNKFNRYLPLKVNGTEFPVPEVGQLAGRIIKSVVVLAPVEYEGRTANDDRLGRAVSVESVRTGAAPPLRALARNPSRLLFSRWLDHEKTLPSNMQSVVLLVAQSPEGSEIFMYDINSEKASRLRGELSRTFVEVAESNSSSKDLDGLEPSN